VDVDGDLNPTFRGVGDESISLLHGMYSDSLLNQDHPNVLTTNRRRKQSVIEDQSEDALKDVADIASSFTARKSKQASIQQFFSPLDHS